MAGDRTKPLDSVELVPTNALVPELNKLFLASGDDGMLRVFRGDSLELLDLLHLEPGPNRVVYEPKSKLVCIIWDVVTLYPKYAQWGSSPAFVGGAVLDVSSEIRQRLSAMNGIR